MDTLEGFILLHSLLMEIALHLDQRTRLRVWNAISGYELAQFHGHTSLVSSVKFSPDGIYIVSGLCDKSVRIWDAVSGHQISLLNGHTGSV